ncbi:hypothetical protein DACRYDRAFT_103282 [Dacryopinax primogenitus]|uniref:INO80 complex subunit F domain-containing protein n=1 Tax=Dacryopinax primogenitus (strain DJM 731) TaxID=1858805 RepID=M5G801_DACPD|nr:uncharacterized protein DACRYDRAFT_103282 [Dacryopinax primogenitus]EJU06336.1 hypothetical protein DACRYDRAFT_103282 [Dacryopinax primogenitus]
MSTSGGELALLALQTATELFLSKVMSGRIDKGKTKIAADTSNDEEADYRECYYDLKKCTQDIEENNDKLHLQILQTRRNIQRIRMERAILLERLASMPNLPPEPLPHTRYSGGSDSSMEDDMVPTVAAFQTLIRKGVAKGLHKQLSAGYGAQASSPEVDDDVVSPISADEPFTGAAQSYQALPPPGLPESAYKSAAQLQQEAHQQPLPLPQQPIASTSSNAPRVVGRQIPFGPPAPNRTKTA